ncbi:MAG TPA: hypothetical protein VGN35_03630 [Jatrophihabitantaceae bacterium]|jgi:hypothetical protein|nr:hypothetical protein [Jatrophihabitantaceae bacterium]
MDYLVCPDDGERLKATPGKPESGQPLLVACPGCGRRFTFGPTGLVRLPPDLDGENR